jgi:hypothetical protein
MKGVVICEGNTDLTLLQYFLEKVYNWQYIENNQLKSYQEQISMIKTKGPNDIKWFRHARGNFLCLVSSGGVSGITVKLQQILDINLLGTDVPFDRIVIISDRDEIDTEEVFNHKLVKIFTDFKIELPLEGFHNRWTAAQYTDMLENVKGMEFLLLLIPFEETGAIETFLLNALQEACETDRKVISQCKNFIDTIDCNDKKGRKKYLKHRREITKAKFDAAFVVMTPANAFMERQNILRSVPWEQYESIQQSFKQIGKLSEVSKQG